MPALFKIVVALLLIGLFPTLVTAQGAPPVTVFAAASLSDALQEAAAAYEKAGGAKVRLSFAASSTLAKQIEAGAAADIFISADEAWMDYLKSRKLIADETRRPLLTGRLALVVPSETKVQIDLAKDRDWLAKLGPGRIATGDPAHVPAGKYAQQALTKLGLWSEIEPRLARADNVRNALVLVERGEAAAGIVYATDAAASKRVTVAGLFPETSHDRIVYPMAMMHGREKGEAMKLYDFLVSPAARGIFAKFGFGLP